MTVFKTLWKIVASYKGIIILYSAMLLLFGAFNMQSNDSSSSFQSEKPDIVIINNDGELGITKNLISYLDEVTNIKEMPEDNIKDALFYRDINAVVIIPTGYNEQALMGKSPQIKIEKNGDYLSSLLEMIVSKYTKLVNTYSQLALEEDELISLISDTLATSINTEIISTVDNSEINRSTFYFNFASYSLLAGCVYVICLVLASFKKEAVHKRTVISSMSYKKYNRILLAANSLFAIALWLLYVIVGFILLKDTMLSSYGIIYLINSFVFVLCCLSFAFLIGNLIQNKNALNGIINVVALGSSFLCGAFVPAVFLPESVLKVAHILPSYWYINTNETLKTIEVFNLDTLNPIILNLLVLILFFIIFTIIANVLAKRKRIVG